MGPLPHVKGSAKYGVEQSGARSTQPGVACVLFSPGWVKTDMGGSGAEITPDESVSDMRALIERLTIDDTGKFLRRNGSELPW